MTQTHDENCLFCKIVKGEIPCHKVYENEKVLAFLDIFPANLGHTLIIPKNHAENLFEIDDETIAYIGVASKLIANKLKNNLGAKAVSVFQSNGNIAGQEVMHYHMHLVPRNDDGTANPTKLNIQRIMNLEAVAKTHPTQLPNDVAKQVLESLK